MITGEKKKSIKNDNKFPAVLISLDNIGNYCTIIDNLLFLYIK